MNSVHSVSLPVSGSCDESEDRAITAEELEALRLWMRSDAPAWDEPPALGDDAYLDPEPEDARWWAEFQGGGCPASNPGPAEPRLTLLDRRSYGPFTADLFEDPRWDEADEPTGRYVVRSFSGGRFTSQRAFGSLGDARCWLETLTTPAPDDDRDGDGWYDLDLCELPALSDDRTDAVSGWADGAGW